MSIVCTDQHPNATALSALCFLFKHQCLLTPVMSLLSSPLFPCGQHPGGRGAGDHRHRRATLPPVPHTGARRQAPPQPRRDPDHLPLPGGEGDGGPPPSTGRDQRPPHAHVHRPGRAPPPRQGGAFEVYRRDLFGETAAVQGQEDSHKRTGLLLQSIRWLLTWGRHHFWLSYKLGPWRGSFPAGRVSFPPFAHFVLLS